MQKAIEWRRRIEEEKLAPLWKNEFSLNFGQTKCKELPHCRVERLVGGVNTVCLLALLFFRFKETYFETEKKKIMKHV